MWQGVVRTVRGLVDLAWPPECLACGAMPEEGNGLSLCAHCCEHVNLLQAPFCAKCAAPVPEFREPGARCQSCKDLPAHFERTFAALEYLDAVPDIIRNYKFHQCRDAAPVLAGLLAETARTQIPDSIQSRLDAWLTVPTHPASAEARGYDHMDLLARLLKSKLGWPRLRRALRVVHLRPGQYTLDGKAARFRNVAGNYAVTRPAEIAGKTLLLVDDVLTTGATAAECSKALKAAGAKAVYVLVLARAHRE